MNPVRNAEIKLTESATFSDIPCWTKSDFRKFETLQCTKRQVLTSISLNTSSDLSRSDFVEKCDVLPENSFEVPLSDSFRVNFSRVNPRVHVYVCANEHSGTCMLISILDSDKPTVKLTDTNQITGVFSGCVTKMCGCDWYLLCCPWLASLS
jgi:hypothetical protein